MSSVLYAFPRSCAQNIIHSKYHFRCFSRTYENLSLHYPRFTSIVSDNGWQLLQSPCKSFHCNCFFTRRSRSCSRNSTSHDHFAASTTVNYSRLAHCSG
ncbi:hypothetical protein PUN28_012901 [Cardiocondyla obscurior]|uniref:Uncharacterized protein n=1 Tax=Cardiocondyla obscurior TaxID=286306 RepID=A0AAW2F967_9HYME